jgi:RNase P subunit RPR2
MEEVMKERYCGNCESITPHEVDERTQNGQKIFVHHVCTICEYVNFSGDTLGNVAFDIQPRA